MHAWSLCSFAILTCWLYRLILLPILTHQLFLLYVYPIHLNMFILVVIYLVHLNVINSLCFILSCSSSHIVYPCYILILLIIFLLSLYVDMDDIPTLSMTTCCMSAFFLCNACIVFLCGSRIYLLISNPLVLVMPFSLVLTFSHVRPCVSWLLRSS